MSQIPGLRRAIARSGVFVPVAYTRMSTGPNVASVCSSAKPFHLRGIFRRRPGIDRNGKSFTFELRCNSRRRSARLAEAILAGAFARELNRDCAADAAGRATTSTTWPFKETGIFR